MPQVSNSHSPVFRPWFTGSIIRQWKQRVGLKVFDGKQLKQDTQPNPHKHTAPHCLKDAL
jgi:hypothetical protein